MQEESSVVQGEMSVYYFDVLCGSNSSSLSVRSERSQQETLALSLSLLLSRSKVPEGSGH